MQRKPGEIPLRDGKAGRLIQIDPELVIVPRFDQTERQDDDIRLRDGPHGVDDPLSRGEGFLARDTRDAVSRVRVGKRPVVMVKQEGVAERRVGVQGPAQLGQHSNRGKLR